MVKQWRDLSPLWRRKLIFISVFLVVQAVCYSITNKIQVRPFVPMTYSSWDHAVPYMPWTTLIYVSFYLILFVPLMMCDNDELLEKVFYSLLAVTALTTPVFALFPTRFPWNHCDYTDVFSVYIMAPMRDIDNHGVNAFPSQHAAYSLISPFVFLWYGRRKEGVLLLIWGSAVAASTVTVKQHYVVDTLAGVAFALAALLLVNGSWRGKEEARDPHIHP